MQSVYTVLCTQAGSHRALSWPRVRLGWLHWLVNLIRTISSKDTVLFLLIFNSGSVPKRRPSPSPSFAFFSMSSFRAEDMTLSISRHSRLVKNFIPELAPTRFQQYGRRSKLEVKTKPLVGWCTSTAPEKDSTSKVLLTSVQKVFEPNRKRNAISRISIFIKLRK